MEVLDSRKEKILKAIVQEYILTAEPIGSRTLARRYNLGVSPATIRNEMADLEEMGLLKQPHTSAGRVPTDQGYRVYVDSLMERVSLSDREIDEIKRRYSLSKKNEIQELIEETSDLLSAQTRHTSLVMGPNLQESTFQHIQMVPISSRRVMILLVTDTGLVQNRMVHLPGELSRRDLGEISSFLNERLQGLSLDDINEEMIHSLERELINRFSLLDQTLDLINTIIDITLSQGEGKIYLGGTTNILEQPEFHDLEKVKMVLRILEHEDLLYRALSGIEQGRMNIVIGEENEFEEIHDCSLVTATYFIRGRRVGKIGVLGPKRMEYPRIISVVDYMANILSQMLSGGEQIDKNYKRQEKARGGD